MEIYCNEQERALALYWGKQRAAIMANKPNKEGYAPGLVKSTSHHTAEQFEALGILAEIGMAKLLGLDYNDSNIYVAVAELDEHGNLPAACKTPDLAGIWEVRRTEYESSPIKMWKKDADANAYVVQAVVEHQHLAGGRIRPSGRVLFVGWADAASMFERKAKNGCAKTTMRKPMELLPAPFNVLWSKVAA